MMDYQPASELVPQMEPKSCAQAICTDQVWEVRKIIGKEVVNDVFVLLGELGRDTGA